MFVLPFCITLTILIILNTLRHPDELITPLIVISLGLFLLFFILKHFTISILFTSIAIALLTGQRFLTEKKRFNEKKTLDICSVEYVKIRGKLLQFPLIGNGSSTILLNAVSLKTPQNNKNRFVIRIIVQGDLRHLCMGDTIEIDSQIKSHRPPVNFFDPLSESYQLVNQVHFAGYSKSSLFAERKAKTNLLFQLTGYVREKVRGHIERKYLSPDGSLEKEGQMLEALLLGDRGRLDPHMKEILLRSGIFHLFAISGAHIGIIALFTMFLLNRINLRMQNKYLILIITLLFFLMLTGFKISAQRAVFMAVLIAVSKILYLRSDILNVISFTGLILLLKDPRYFVDPGYILTFTITAGIVSGRRIFFRNGAETGSLIKESAAANLNASVISIPLSLYFFMRYSFTGLIAGPALLPVAAVIMCLSLPVIPLSLLPPFFTEPLLFLPDIFLNVFFFITASFSGKLDLSIFRPPPPFVLLLLSIALFFLLSWSGERRLVRNVSLFLLAASLSAMVIKPPRYDPVFPEVYFLDVGQGDASIIVLPGGDSLLIDGGGSRFGDFEAGKQIVLPFILRKKINIRWIAVSHYHPDHCRGVTELIPILRPEEVWLSSVPDHTPLFDELIDQCRGFTRIRKVSSGFRAGRNTARIEILYPGTVLTPFKTENNHSQVIRLTAGSKTILFTGDIEEEGENALVARYGEQLKCNILKVPHHGSATSSSSGLLRAANPDIAVFSLGYRNSFNFPHHDVVSRYEKTGARLLFTSTHGGIMAALHPNEIVFNVSRFVRE